MKVSVKGGGGFAGTLEHFEIDTRRIAQGEAIEALLQNLDFFHAPAPQAPVGADIPHWEITVDDGCSAAPWRSPTTAVPAAPSGNR